MDMGNTFDLVSLVTTSQNSSEQYLTFLYQMILLQMDFNFQKDHGV